MAKNQYRISTIGNWTSNYGYSFIAINNTSGSGKKITLRSLEVQVSSTNNGSAILGSMPCTLYRCATPLIDGESMSFAACRQDSGTALPSTVVVRRRSIATSYTTVLRRFMLERRTGAAGTQNIGITGSPMQSGFFGGGSGYRSARKAMAATVEPLMIANGEALVLVAEPNATPYCCPVRISLRVSINGKTVTWNFISALYPGYGVWSIENTGANTVKLLDFSWTELGTNDTPTIRVVPIGQLYASDVPDSSKKGISVFKMDSTAPTLTESTFIAFTDIGLVPSGVPEVMINDGSTGSPKGMNYLHTRDFNGPMYRNFLPEMCHCKGVGVNSPDMLGLSYGHNKKLNGSDLLVRRRYRDGPCESIVLQPGEGIAIVSSAETAVGVQAAFSGWPLLEFAAQIDVEPAQIPTVSITGMVIGSRWRVERVSDSSLVETGVSVDGTGSFTYTTEDTPLSLRLKVRKASAAPFYKPYEITFSLTSAGISLPVSQIVDP